MVEKERVETGTGEVSRERWHLMTSLDSRRRGLKELLQVIRNHWKAENSRIVLGLGLTGYSVRRPTLMHRRFRRHANGFGDGPGQTINNA